MTGDGGTLELAYRGPHDFVSVESTFAPYAPTPAGAPTGERSRCQFNALATASVNQLPYVEGYATIASGFRVVQHAWNERDGKVVDVTWHDDAIPASARASRSASGYLGVRFSAWRAYAAAWEGDASVLNDHHREFPLLAQKCEGETMPDDHEKVLAELAAKSGVTRGEFKTVAVAREEIAGRPPGGHPERNLTDGSTRPSGRQVAKDRKRTIRPAPDVRIEVERSSAHPVEYAIVLLVRRDGGWNTVRTFDNAHHFEEHHEHAYIGTEKQEPTVRYGPANDAMAYALEERLKEWPALVEEWERTR